MTDTNAMRAKLISTLKAAGGIHNPDANAPHIADAILALLATDRAAGVGENERLIAEAAKLIAPGNGETVFYLRVGGDRSQLTIKSSLGVEPSKALADAIKALQAEADDLGNCPIHAASSSAPADASGEVEALRVAMKGLRETLQSIANDEGDTTTGRRCLAAIAKSRVPRQQEPRP